MSVYEVTGRTAYRSHEPGARFEADLPDDVERRALSRGAITVVEQSKPVLRQGSYRLPIRMTEGGFDGT